jgi:hypothetical protein
MIILKKVVTNSMKIKVTLKLTGSCAYFSCQVDNSTADVETKLQGSGSWKPGMDVQLIHTPGHTEVSCWILCLLALLIHTLCLVKGMWGEEKEWGKDASVRLWTHLVGREEMKGLIFLNL